MTATLLFGSFLGLLVVGVPIGIALAVASLIVIYSLPFLNPDFLFQGLVYGLNSFPLLAVILFTLAGNIMSRGGIANRLIRVAELFLGRVTGGLGIVAIVACMVVASISGTGSATVAAIGLAMIPAMVQKGYDRAFSGAIVASAGGIGVIIPPSVVMIVYAITAQVSVTDMFLAGILPGIIIGVALMVYTYIQSRRHGYQGSDTKFSKAEALQILQQGILPLLMPFIILGGIYSGLFTPTESAAVGVVYGLVLGVFVYREIKPQDLYGIILQSALLVGAVLVIVGASTAFGRILTIERVPTDIANWVLGVTDSKVLILLAILMLLLVVGTFMETLAAIVILTPLLLPIVTSLGMSPVHFGVVMIVNLAIGFVTPPLGANLFMASQVGQVEIEKLSRAVIGFIFAMIIALLIITFVPWFSLVIPELRTG
ncbi:C4-dicarboxylate ABC transporter permease [Halomonas litopenaei]|uniref:TRAP transporter large permease protein n=2 Tax=Halomonas TaxID=2745 RepID=A0AAU7KUY7_9GAMM|nr:MULTISPECIES: TRAP transporter large permease [Halomonas]MBS8271007.1 TRAP transporter large permease [Halomonas litopenaei]PTL89734.1 C4-dicarboxylate ABC transporter permease [Halomonas sp. SYSU XM8]PTL91944.1 C4-dicarboxylate ABC transporter permease [Halomonas litopenaei]